MDSPLLLPRGIAIMLQIRSIQGLGTCKSVRVQAHEGL